MLKYEKGWYKCQKYSFKLKTSQSQESDARNFHEDEEISDREILDVALSSSIARDKSDTKNDYCYMLTARIINYQVLNDLAVSSPIFISNRSFPPLEYIQNQYSMLTSDPYASSKLVQSLLANIQPKISHFVNKTISDCQNSDLVNQVINVSIYIFLFNFFFLL